MHFVQMLCRAAQINGNSRAIKDGAIQSNWAEAEDRVARLAGALRALGVGEGDRVAILALNSSRYYEAQFAIGWADAVATPLNTRLAPDEIDFILEDSGATHLFVDTTFVSMLSSLGSVRSMRSIICLDGAEPQSAILDFEMLVAEGPRAASPRSCSGDRLAALYYTGGTTGRPKGVMISHGNLVATAVNTAMVMGYDQQSRDLHAAPSFHMSDACSSLAVTLQAGQHVFMPRFEPVAFLNAISGERITHVTVVPTMIGMFINHPHFSSVDTSTLKQVCFGAAPMPDGLLRAVLDRMPATVFQQAWGMTELTGLTTVMPAALWRREEMTSGRLRSCGVSLPLVEARVVDPEGNSCAPGEIGEVVARGATTMLGYWKREDETRVALREGWMHSGDAGFVNEDGLLFIVDRLKDMIVTGGENVYAAEVESVLSLMPEVAEVAVIAVPDERWGERVHAVIVLRDSAETTPEAVIAFCDGKIADFKKPRSVDIRPEPLPLSGAGKILKSVLRAPHWQGRARGVN